LLPELEIEEETVLGLEVLCADADGTAKHS
jgi:hypothetical protein